MSDPMRVGLPRGSSPPAARIPLLPAAEEAVDRAARLLQRVADALRGEPEGDGLA